MLPDSDSLFLAARSIGSLAVHCLLLFVLRVRTLQSTIGLSLDSLVHDLIPVHVFASLR